MEESLISFFKFHDESYIIILRLFKNVQKHMFYVCKLYMQYKYFMHTDETHVSKCGG